MPNQILVPSLGESITEATVSKWLKKIGEEVNYIGREPAASPATGYLKKHLAQQKEIIEKVFS